jgi:hypothetical protein
MEVAESTINQTQQTHPHHYDYPGDNSQDNDHNSLKLDDHP